MIRAITPLVLCTTLALTALPAVAADPTPVATGAGSESTGTEKVETMKSGLKYIDTKVGTGPMPSNGKTVSIAYKISSSGTELERFSAQSPFSFVIGKDQAMKAIEDGVSTMKKGGQRKLIVPPDLAYGAEGAGRVPPNATLDIEIELLDVK